MKILHLAFDDKFLDHAYFLFEKAFYKQNDVIVISASEKLIYVKLEPKKIINVKQTFIKIPRICKSEYQDYDLVIFHSFGDFLYPEICNISEDVPAVWLGWGYDYYDLIGSSENLLLPETRTIFMQQKKSFRTIIGKVIRAGFYLLGISKSRQKCIEKLSVFSPVLPSEYLAVKNARNWNKFPVSACWNYGTIEDHLVKGFEGQQVDGNAILVGNSASLTCNHIETLKFLSLNGLQDRDIVVPLSYGDKSYGHQIAETGERYFGNSFYPLMDFMPIQSYVASIKKCGYVIMNHKRQQAVGNIVIMLYLGSRVFLREENPTYLFLKGMGVSLCSVQELEQNPELLNRPLSSGERNSNRKLVCEYWSQKQGIKRTKDLVEQAMKLKS